MTAPFPTAAELAARARAAMPAAAALWGVDHRTAARIDAAEVARDEPVDDWEIDRMENRDHLHGKDL